MKFTCEKYELQNAVNVAMRAAASKSPIPALEGILITAEPDSVRITGFDLKKGIYTTVDASVRECGSIVLSAKLFGEMIRRMPDGIVSVEADEKQLAVNVKCAQSEYNFIGISPEEYPELPTVDKINSIVLPQPILKNMINKTIFAVSDSEVRPVYTGILFEVEDKLLTLVAVDGYRLAKRVETIEDGQLENCTFIVPGSTLSDIERICADEDGEVEIAVGAKHVSFVIGNTVVVSRRLEGEFLNYRRSLPTVFENTVKVNRAEFMSAIERVAIIVSEKNTNPVRMHVTPGKLELLCLTPIGRADDICKCEGGKELEIGFNSRYLMDALKAATDEELLINFNSASSPSVICAVDGNESYKYMILPVRLRADA